MQNRIFWIPWLFMVQVSIVRDRANRLRIIDVQFILEMVKAKIVKIVSRITVNGFVFDFGMYETAAR